LAIVSFRARSFKLELTHLLVELWREDWYCVLFAVWHCVPEGLKLP
jgi:hypothetical protein